MAYVPRKRIRDLVLKHSEGDITPEEELELTQLCNLELASNHHNDYYSPYAGMLFAGLFGGMFN